jgi:hypothetical protein
MSYHHSIKLANLWFSLHELKQKLDNEIIPIGSHLGIDNPDLMISLEEVSSNIENHFEKFKLSTIVVKHTK